MKIRHTRHIRAMLLSAACVLGASAGLLAPAPAYANPPTITFFGCPRDNGGGLFYCNITYSSGTPATVAWSGSGFTLNQPGSSEFYGSCSIGQWLSVTVTVANASGTTSRSTGMFRCEGGEIIL